MNKVFIVSKSIAYAMLCAMLIAGFGCKKDEEKGPKPIADFASDITTVCKYEHVQFIDNSQNTPNAYEWQFPGGSPDSRRYSGPGSGSMSEFLDIRYDSIGTFPVSLTVRNENGESSITKNNYITVISNPKPIIHGRIIGNRNGLNITITYLGSNESVACELDNNAEIYTFFSLLPEKYLGKTVSMKCAYSTDEATIEVTQSVEITVTQETFVDFTI